MKSTTTLKDITKKLLQKNERAIEQLQFAKSQNDDYQPDFHNVVKPFADEVKECCDSWKELSISWLQKENPKYIYKSQIDATCDNIAALSVQCFFKNTQSKRAKDMYESIKYVLESILKEL